MNIGERIKSIRELKNLSQKQVALSIQMDQSQYSKIERGKTDPTCSTLFKVANALEVKPADIFAIDEPIGDINSLDSPLANKIRLIEELEDEERISIFNIVDGLTAKRQLKNALQGALQKVS